METTDEAMERWSDGKTNNEQIIMTQPITMMILILLRPFSKTWLDKASHRTGVPFNSIWADAHALEIKEGQRAILEKMRSELSPPFFLQFSYNIQYIFCF